MKSLIELTNQKEELEKQLKAINEQIKEKTGINNLMDISVGKFIKITTIPYVGKTLIMKVNKIDTTKQMLSGQAVMITDNLGYKLMDYPTFNMEKPYILFEQKATEQLTYTVEIIDDPNKVDELLMNNKTQINTLLNI